MAYLTINGINFTPLHEGITLGVLASGRYYDHGVLQKGSNPSFGAPIYKEQTRDYTGEDGVATVGHDFRGRPLFCSLIWAGTESSIGSLYKADQESFRQQARYSISMPSGQTFNGCKLQADNPGVWGTIKGATGNSIFTQSFLFMQMSTTN